MHFTNPQCDQEPALKNTRQLHRLSIDNKQHISPEDAKCDVQNVVTSFQRILEFTYITSIHKIPRLITITQLTFTNHVNYFYLRVANIFQPESNTF